MLQHHPRQHEVVIGLPAFGLAVAPSVTAWDCNSSRRSLMAIISGATLRSSFSTRSLNCFSALPPRGARYLLEDIELDANFAAFG